MNSCITKIFTPRDLFNRWYDNNVLRFGVVGVVHNFFLDYKTKISVYFDDIEVLSIKAIECLNPNQVRTDVFDILLADLRRFRFKELRVKITDIPLSVVNHFSVDPTYSTNF